MVKAIRYFSPDSPVDGVVLDVLLNKAREIYRTLGTHVPVPEESETVTEALLQALFLRGQPDKQAKEVQLQLDLGLPEVESLHQRWQLDAERERINRTRFSRNSHSSRTKFARSWRRPTLFWRLPMRFAISSTVPGSASV